MNIGDNLYELLINYEYTNFLIKYSYISIKFVISKQIRCKYIN